MADATGSESGEAQEVAPAAGRCATCSAGCASDADAGFEVGSEHQRMSQRDDIFSRSFWDEAVR